jgi:hypothetical protein
VERSPPRTVSPGKGKRSARTIMSVFEDPTTIKRGWVIEGGGDKLDGA